MFTVCNSHGKETISSTTVHVHEWSIKANYPNPNYNRIWDGRWV